MGIKIIGTQAFIYCDDCGKPLSVTNENGMFCEDMCGYEESVKAGKEINNIIERALKEGI